MSGPRSVRAEHGVTMIEMVISIAVLGIVFGPVTTALYLGFLESDGTRDRITDSASAQILSTYIVDDIQAAGSIALTGTSCHPSSLPASAAVRLQLAWSDGSTTVSYLETGGAGEQHELHRAVCTGSMVTSARLLPHLAPGGFTVTCEDGSGALLPSCPPAPQSVRVRVVAKSLDPQEASSYEQLDAEFHVLRRTA